MVISYPSGFEVLFVCKHMKCKENLPDNQNNSTADKVVPAQHVDYYTQLPIISVILISGSKWYKKAPPTGNIVIFDVYKVIKVMLNFDKTFVFDFYPIVTNTQAKMMYFSHFAEKTKKCLKIAICVNFCAK